MSRTADITLRAAQTGDAEAIRRCARGAYHQYIAAIGRTPAPMVADFDSLITQGHVQVALRGTALIGFVVSYVMGAAMHLENVAVSEPGAGVGKRLIGWVEDRAREQGLRSVHLYTNAKMAANLSLYPYLGYTQTDRRIEYGFDRVYFEKVLL